MDSALPDAVAIAFHHGFVDGYAKAKGGYDAGRWSSWYEREAYGSGMHLGEKYRSHEDAGVAARNEP